MRTARLWLIAAYGLVASATLTAHDFRLSSTHWTATPGATVTILANVGDRFPQPRLIEIKPSDFHSYLTHEGLDWVIRAGDGPSSRVTDPLGLPAELVPHI